MRTGKCSNLNARLGFPCMTDFSKKLPGDTITYTEIDHIDGNHYNNDPSNLQELCKNCHLRKSIDSGDLSSRKNKGSEKIKRRHTIKNFHRHFEPVDSTADSQAIGATFPGGTGTTDVAEEDLLFEEKDANIIAVLKFEG